METEKPIPVTVLMEPALEMRLRILAALSRKSRADIVRDIIVAGLPEFEKKTEVK